MNVLLIDVSAVFWPAWHAGDEGNGVEARNRTVARCRKLAYGYDRAVICVDAGDSGRKEKLPEYKANRPPKPAPAIEQMDRAIEYLGKDGFHVLRGKGFEADDTIATACAWAAEKAEIRTVTIACADKDLFQLVRGKIRILSLSTDALYGPDEIGGKIGAPPDLVPDLLALVGDKADNIPGCPGIGMKTAAALIQEFGALEQIFAANEAGKVSGSSRAENLFEYAPRCLAARDLIRLRTDAPIDPEIIMEEPEREPTPEVPEGDAPPADAIETTAVEKDSDPQRETLPAPVRSFSTQLEPASMKQAHWVAERVISSRLFSGYGNPDAALMCIIAGREMGLGAIASLRGFHVIKGRMCLSAQLMAGVVLRSGLAEYFEPILAECNDEQAVWATKRKGSPREQKLTFTMADARKANLTGKSDSNWSKYPATMLRWRACSDLARAVYPDICGNVYTDADGMDDA